MHAHFPKLSRRKFYLHVGAAKTGTTAIQEFCGRNRPQLLALGVWYPLIDHESEFKQQWLVQVFRSGNRRAFYEFLERMEDLCPDQAHTILLSAEGLSVHFQRFPPEGHLLFREFIHLLRPHGIFVARDRDAFLYSFYKQALINGRSLSTPEFGTNETFEAWCERPHLRNLSDPHFMVERYIEYFGAGRFTQLTYSKDIVKDLLSLVLDAPVPTAWSFGHDSNLSLSTAEAELIRLLNHTGIANEAKGPLIAWLKAEKTGKKAPAPHPAQAAHLVAMLQQTEGLPVQSSARFAVAAAEVEVLRQRLLATFMPLVAQPGLQSRAASDRPGRKILFGCVADNSHKYMSQALRLLQSLRWFGGNLADAPFVVAMVEGVASEYLPQFAALDATIRVVPRFSPLHGPSNKLSLVESLLDASPQMEFDTFVLLDCDTVILQDPSAWLAGDAFRARMAGKPTVPHPTFKNVFSHFNRPVPAPAYRTNPSDEPTIWYCNAGVLVFPRSLLESFGRRWLSWNRRLLENLDVLGESRFYCEQASLSLAFAEQPVAFNALPLEMNYPLQDAATAISRMRQPAEPVIVHYHNQISAQGYFDHAPNWACQAMLDRYNARLSSERRTRLDNRSFWNFRYTHAPDIGMNGAASTELAKYKRALLQRMLGFDAPAATLDVGCGDHHVGSILPAEGYLGIDISSAIIDRNRTLYPGRRFECLDFVSPGQALPTAEAVVCLDVTCHVDQDTDYQTFVRHIVEATGRTGLIAGYEEKPTAIADMCFYHEPLSQTLARYGAHSLQPLGHYPSGMTVWRYGTGPIALAPLPIDHAGLITTDSAWWQAYHQELEGLRRQLTDQRRMLLQHEATISQYRNSRYWQATSPLRRAVTLLRRLAKI